MIIVCFGHEWDSWLRRANRILMGLCKKGIAKQVIFFERPLTLRNIYEYLTRKANCTIKERCRRLFKKGFWSKVADNIIVVTPIIPAVFFHSRVLQAINETIRTVQHLIVFKILLRYRKSRNRRILLWFQRPEFNSRYIKYINSWKILYDCTEDYIELLGNEDPLLLNKYRKDDTIITENADVITTVSKEYASVKAKSNSNTHWISNGVDCNAFDAICTINMNKMEKKKSNALFSFIGILNWRHDIDLLYKLSKYYPECIIELVGSNNTSMVTKIIEKNIPNIRFIPGIPAKDIPLYLKGVDVCLSLFKYDYLNRTSSSMKIYQYLASGKPIVSYPVSDAEYFKDVIYLAKDRNKYIKLVGIAMNESTDDSRIAVRKKYAQQNDWSIKVDRFCRLI